MAVVIATYTSVIKPDNIMVLCIIKVGYYIAFQFITNTREQCMNAVLFTAFCTIIQLMFMQNITVFQFIFFGKKNSCSQMCVVAYNSYATKTDHQRVERWLCLCRYLFPLNSVAILRQCCVVRVLRYSMFIVQHCEKLKPHLREISSLFYALKGFGNKLVFLPELLRVII